MNLYAPKLSREDYSEDKALSMYQRLGDELVEELNVLNTLTDIIQIFKDNDIIALRQIFENSKRINLHQEFTIKAG